MYLSRNARQFPFDQVARGSVATIGSFDGFHLGHQAILEHVLAEADKRALPSILMSFEPTPKEFFQADRPPARLMRFREKFDALSAAGVDIFFCPRFNDVMKNVSGATFIRQILVHALNVRHLVIGDDFRFAQGREGHLDMLRRAGRTLGFTVEQMPSVVENDTRISSSAIRDALWNGNLPLATKYLGRHYRMSGKVNYGAGVGRTLGYPTANVNLDRKQSAVMGIFAVRVSGKEWGPLDAVASVGTRPTFGGVKPLLEVHIFDFDRNIYGEYIHVDFIERLRSEEKFAEVAMLVREMDRDSAKARVVLARTSKRHVNQE